MRKLGINQEAIIGSLTRHGSYYPGCGWTWGSQSETEKLLNSLVKRGIVKVSKFTTVNKRTVNRYQLTRIKES